MATTTVQQHTAMTGPSSSAHHHTNPIGVTHFNSAQPSHHGAHPRFVP